MSGEFSGNSGTVNGTINDTGSLMIPWLFLSKVESIRKVGSVYVSKVEVVESTGCVTMKDMQTTPPSSEVSPSKSDCEWCAMF